MWGNEKQVAHICIKLSDKARKVIVLEESRK